jgi:hypothetical protein
MSVLKSILRSTLTQLLDLLGEDELMHFRKIHKPIDELTKKDLVRAIALVERTLEKQGVEYAYGGITIKLVSDLDPL